jgi:hypothetical protein
MATVTSANASQSQVDSVGEDSGEQELLVFGGVPGFEAGEVAGEAGPAIDLHEQAVIRIRGNEALAWSISGCACAGTIVSNGVDANVPDLSGRPLVRPIIGH